MKKEEIARNNEEAMKGYVMVTERIKAMYPYGMPYYSDRQKDKEFERLDSCTAWVIRDGSWLHLLSYDTVIASIDTVTDTLYDYLRYVYGYTATSAKHISKFRKYGRGTYGCEHEYTYR